MAYLVQQLSAIIEDSDRVCTTRDLKLVFSVVPD
jgi:hypothetical protein